MRLAALVVTLAGALLAAAPATAQSDELQEANQLFKQGQFDRALDRVDVYLKGKPKDARGRFLKGLIFAEQGKPNDAIKVFTELTQEFPELPEPYNNLAVLYASQGQYDKARSALEMAIRTHPSYATAHENLGRHLRQDGEPGLRQGAATRQEQRCRADQAQPDQGTLPGQPAPRRSPPRRGRSATQVAVGNARAEAAGAGCAVTRQGGSAGGQVRSDQARRQAVEQSG